MEVWLKNNGLRIMVSIYCWSTACFQWPVVQRPDITIHAPDSEFFNCFKSYKIMDMDLAIKKKTLKKV